MRGKGDDEVEVCLEKGLWVKADDRWQLVENRSKTLIKKVFISHKWELPSFIVCHLKLFVFSSCFA